MNKPFFFFLYECSLSSSFYFFLFVNWRFMYKCVSEICQVRDHVQAIRLTKYRSRKIVPFFRDLMDCLAENEHWAVLGFECAFSSFSNAFRVIKFLFGMA